MSMAAGAQSASDSSALRFEVASLKSSAPGGRGGIIRPSPGGERYLATGIPLQLLMMVAYRVKADQITGGPAWTLTDRFDMNAKAERPSTVEELHTMLKNLLADRFHLQFHRETKELPVYALTVDKAGIKLTPHEAQSAGDPWMDQSVDQVVSVKMKATSVPMDYFAWRLGQMLDRPVIDLTKLKGGYDFSLAYTRDLPPGLNEGAFSRRCVSSWACASMRRRAPSKSSSLTTSKSPRRTRALGQSCHRPYECTPCGSGSTSSASRTLPNNRSAVAATRSAVNPKYFITSAPGALSP